LDVASSLDLGFERPSLCCDTTQPVEESRMSRIEQKLSSPMGGEYRLQGTVPGNVPGFGAPAGNSIYFGGTAQELRLVGADNGLKGVLREMPRSSVRENRRFSFFATNSQQENPLPSRVTTLDDAKSFVRKHIAEGQWQHAGQSANARMGTLSESQLFGANGKPKAAQASTADTAFTSLFDTAAARAQTPPSLLRTAAEAQRHVRLETGKSDQANPDQPESAATAPEARSDGVAPVQAEPVPSQEATKLRQLSSASARSAATLRRLRADQPRKTGELTLILSAQGELLSEPEMSAATAAEMEKQQADTRLRGWVTALITAILSVLLLMAFYLWGPRPSSGLTREAALATATPLSPSPALTSIGVEKPEAALRSPAFEAQKNTSTASSSGKSKSKRRAANPCAAGAGSGDADAACPNAAQDSRTQERESGVPPSATTSNVTRGDRPEGSGLGEKPSEGVGSQ
jgi:hypothetical protein